MFKYPENTEYHYIYILSTDLAMLNYMTSIFWYKVHIKNNPDKKV